MSHRPVGVLSVSDFHTAGVHLIAQICNVLLDCVVCKLVYLGIGFLGFLFGGVCSRNTHHLRCLVILKISLHSFEVEPRATGTTTMTNESPRFLTDISTDERRNNSRQFVQVIRLVVMWLGTKHTFSHNVFLRILLILTSLSLKIIHDRVLIDLRFVPMKNPTL